MPPDSTVPDTTASKNTRIIKVRADGQRRELDDSVATEEPLEIRVNSQSIAITMRTPGHDEELALGFLLSEGLIKKPGQITHLAHCQTGEAALTGNVINAFTSPDVDVDFDKLTRHVFASSSCGLCGKASVEEVHQHFPPIGTRPQISLKVLQRLPDTLHQHQSVFEQTGGLHAAAVFNLDGNLLVCREDIGRHNAVDKVLGHLFQQGIWPLEKHILMVSGRASFEILQKALAARIPVISAVSAPSSLAVEFARESGQVLAGFVRNGGMNLYSHAEAVTC